MKWLVLVLRLPSEPSRDRVAVWRELRKGGAGQLGQGSWALPAKPTLTELDDGARAVAMACYDAVLRPHLEEGCRSPVPPTLPACHSERPNGG